MGLRKYLRERNALPKPLAVRPRVVVFDFDGTVADTFEAAYEILNLLADEMGFRRLERDELEHARDMRTRQVMKFLGISATKLPKVARRGSEEISARIQQIQPLPGVSEALRQLHAMGYRLGILTSNSHANVTAFLKNHDLEVFEFIRGSSKLMGKAREIRKVRKGLGFKREEMLFVGDETRDISATQKAGVPIAVVTWGYNSVKALTEMKPTYIFNTPQELVEFLAAQPEAA